MIDMGLAYRKHPEQIPKFGLKSWMEDSERIVSKCSRLIFPRVYSIYNC